MRPCLASARAQIVLIGLICSLVIGTWNALTSAVGGIDDVQLASLATALLYAVSIPAGFAAPTLLARMGIKCTTFLGTVGYLAYGIALMLYPTHLGAGWVVAAACLNGASGGLLTSSYLFLIMALPPPESKGTLLALFWCLFNSGAVLGSLAQFATNYAHAAARSSELTQVAFAGLMCLGCALCALLRPPPRVRQKGDGAAAEGDGAPPKFHGGCGVLRAAVAPCMLLLAPCFAASGFGFSFQFGCFNTRLFTPRTQGLNDACFWAAQSLTALLVGRALDSARRSVRTRALLGLAACGLVMSAAWGAALIAVGRLGLDNTTAPVPMDFLEHGRPSPEWVGLLGMYSGWGLADACLLTLTTWLVAQLDTDTRTLSVYASVFNAWQAVGQAVAWALGARSWQESGAVPPSAQARVNASLIAVALVLAAALFARAPRATAHHSAPLLGAET